MNVLDVNDINLIIRQKTILKDITFQVEKGEVFGLVGYNGAGKTSLLKVIMGLLVDYSGSLKILGNDDLNKGRKSIGCVLDNTRMDMNASAGRNIKEVARMLNIHDEKVEKDVLKLVGLENVGKKYVRDFSLGMKKRLMIALAILGSPQILVLDEPFNGIDIEGVQGFHALIKHLSNDGVTVIITSHNISELIKLCTSYGVMCNGKFVKKYRKQDALEEKVDKYLINMDDAEIKINAIRKEYPDIYFGLKNDKEIICVTSQQNENCIRETMQIKAKYQVSKESINLEDVLLWKMNGH